ncbi:MAG: hypothetical protein WDN01_18000 [Rhizomicrobium sp.]
MHAFAQFTTRIFAPLESLAALLAGHFAAFACTPWGAFAVAAVVVTSIAVGIGCGSWAIGERMRSSRHRERMLATLRRQQVALHFRDALIGALPEAVVVLRANARAPLSFGGGSALLKHCLAGPDAVKLATAIDDLMSRGAAFALSVRTIGIRPMAVRGRRVGDSVAIFIQDSRSFSRPSSRDATLAANAAQGRVVRNRHLAVVDDAAPKPPSPDEAAAIDSLTEGAIVVGADGRLRQYNPAFARQWSLRAEEIGAHPHLRELAALCAAVLGPDGIWDVVASGAASAEPERYNDWGALIRGDGQAVSLSFSRMPGGDTRVIFAEVLPAPRLPALAALTMAA